jgi:hypothetical protein
MYTRVLCLRRTRFGNQSKQINFVLPMEGNGVVQDRRRFLVLFDYGQGGRWFWISAHSGDEILAKYPELRIVEENEVPTSMSHEILAQRPEYDIDHPPRGALAAIVRQRHNRGTTR